jgi:CheY-like chemotaxis protein
VIALTARAGADDLRCCIEAGASACLVKPVDPRELKRMLDTFLKGGGGGEDQ